MRSADPFSGSFSLSCVRLAAAGMALGLLSAAPVTAQPCVSGFFKSIPWGPTGATVLGAWDFNRDGRTDVLIQDGGVVKVGLNSGGGTFTVGDEVFTGSVVVGDFDGDGILDFVGVQQNVPAPLVVFLKGDGKGGFHEPSSFRASSYLSSPVAGDFDGDGHLDLAAIAGGGYIWWYRGDGLGGFGTPSMFLPSFPYVSGLDVLDIDGRGHDDLLVSGGGFKTFGFHSWALQSNGSYAEVFGPSAGGFECGFEIAKGDVDGDGNVDAVSVNRYIGGCLNSIRTFLVRPGGGLNLEQAAAPLFKPVLADFDGDGRLDLAALTAAQGYPFAANTLSLQAGDGTGRFGPPVLFGIPYAVSTQSASLTAIDVDGDGRPDLILSGLSGSPPLLFLNTCERHRPATPGPLLPVRRRAATPGS